MDLDQLASTGDAHGKRTLNRPSKTFAFYTKITVFTHGENSQEWHEQN